MAFPSSFLRTTLKWTLPSGEVANTTVAWRPSSALVSLDEATADAFETRLLAAWTALKSKYPINTKYVGMSVSWISTTGTTLSRIDRPETPVPGTDSSPPLPNEVAIVVSLRTATAGRRTRGRMFFPAPVGPWITDDAVWNATFVNLLKATVADMLQDVTVGSEVFTPVVASATGGLLTAVTAVAVGNVPDAQRRRRDGQVEAYSVEVL